MIVPLTGASIAEPAELNHGPELEEAI